MRIGNFLLSVAFSPRSHTSGKDHQSAPNGHSYGWYMIATARKASFLLLLAGITAVAVMLLLQPGQMYTDFPSWRNVTMLQIIKMHLSPRPSQVNRKVVCPNPMPKPGIFLSQMDTSKVRVKVQSFIIIIFIVATIVTLSSSSLLLSSS